MGLLFIIKPRIFVFSFRRIWSWSAKKLLFFAGSILVNSSQDPPSKVCKIPILPGGNIKGPPNEWVEGHSNRCPFIHSSVSVLNCIRDESLNYYLFIVCFIPDLKFNDLWSFRNKCWSRLPFQSGSSISQSSLEFHPLKV